MQANCEECGDPTQYIAEDGYYFLCKKHGHSVVSAGQVPDGLLTPRQLQVACLIADGYTNLEIADELNISHGHARNLSSQVIQRLKVPNRHRVAAVLRRWQLP